jgi:hypothetical protein
VNCQLYRPSAPSEQPSSISDFSAGANRAIPHFYIVQLHSPTPRPEQLRQKSQTRTFLSDLYLSVGANRAIPHFYIVQLHSPTPRPEQLRQKSQTRTFLSDLYLSVGANRAISHFY